MRGIRREATSWGRPDKSPIPRPLHLNEYVSSAVTETDQQVTKRRQRLQNRSCGVISLSWKAVRFKAPHRDSEYAAYSEQEEQRSSASPTTATFRLDPRAQKVFAGKVGRLNWCQVRNHGIKDANQKRPFTFADTSSHADAASPYHAVTIPLQTPAHQSLVSLGERCPIGGEIGRCGLTSFPNG